MPKYIPKTMYILGAGASYHTEAPLLNNFLLKAKDLHHSNNVGHFKDGFDRFFKWLDELRSSAYYMNINLDNLENVFSLAAMEKQLRLNGGEEVFDACSEVMFHTLDQTVLRWKGRQLFGSEIYKTFIDKLEENKIEMTRYIDDPIVTFNYDLQLDYPIEFRGASIEYGLKEEQQQHSFKVFKLHGSMNFLWNKDKTEIVYRKASPIPERSVVFPEEDGKVFYYNYVFNVCKGEIPAFIPPTWAKGSEKNGQIYNVWRHAVEESRNVNQIIVIGYSLPQTDTFFQYLLTIGLKNNNRLNRVIVIDPNANKEDFQGRYRKVFSQGLFDNGKLKFVPETFEDFVLQDMDRVARGED